MFSLMLTRGALCYLLCHFITVFWGYHLFRLEKKVYCSILGWRKA